MSNSQVQKHLSDLKPAPLGGKYAMKSDYRANRIEQKSLEGVFLETALGGRAGTCALRAK
jgi:hypothetical protein